MSRILDADEINLNVIRILSGTADPTAGGGVARAIGSIYSRGQAGAVALYNKTTAANTGWDKLVQSFAWKSIKDYGVVGDGVTDDTAAIQQALNDVNAAGGGVVYIPFGTYAYTQLSMAGMVGVQVLGSGPGSVLKWVFNAGAAAGSGLSITAGASRCRVTGVRFDGSGLTNPGAVGTNHLVAVGTGAGGTVLETFIDGCWFTGMVANSGDGIHVLGAAGNLVSRLWIHDNEFDGCSRFGVGCEQGWQFGWILNNYFTNCTTEIGFVSTANVNTDSIQIAENHIVHTGTTRHAIRLEGDATGLITRLIVRQNIVNGGYITTSNVQYTNIGANTVLSGAYANTDAVLRIFGTYLDSLCFANIIDRDPGASAGPCITVESSGAAVPARFGISRNVLINEVSTSQMIKIVDAVNFRVGGNTCRASNAGATTQFAIDVQAVTVALNNALLVDNQVTAAAGTFKAAFRLLANGANVTAASIVANQGNQIDSGAQFEVGGGGGNFTGNVILLGGNNFNAGTSNYVNVGGAGVVPRVGFNAGSTAGAQLFEGTGSPETVVTARAGSMYLNDSGGAGTSVYYKETGTGNVGWLGIGGSMVVFGTNDTTTAATAVFLGPGFITTATATEVKINLTRAATIRSLRVQVATAGTGAQTVTYTVRKNGADTALLTTISNTATGAATDLADSFTVVAGDLLSISVVKAAGVAAGQAGVTAVVEMI